MTHVNAHNARGISRPGRQDVCGEFFGRNDAIGVIGEVYEDLEFGVGQPKCAAIYEGTLLFTIDLENMVPEPAVDERADTMKDNGLGRPSGGGRPSVVPRRTDNSWRIGSSPGLGTAE